MNLRSVMMGLFAMLYGSSLISSANAQSETPSLDPPVSPTVTAPDTTPVTAENRVVRQEVRNNQYIPSELILAATQLKPGTAYTPEKLRADRTAIEDLGFFEGVLPRAEKTAEGVVIVYEVTEYPRIQRIDVQGNTVVKTNDILNAMTIKEGQVLNAKYLRADSAAIRELYRSKGYFFIEIQRFEPDPTDPSVLRLQILEGRVAKINIKGNRRTRDRVIRNQIRTREGQVFDVDKWQKDVYRVFNLGFFDDVNTSDPREVPGQPGQLEIDLVVKERNTGQLNVGFGYDQRSGLFGLFEVSDPNFRGSGNSLGLNYQRTSDNRNSIEASFGVPYLDRHRTGMSLRIFDRINYRFSGSFFGDDVDDDEGDDDRYYERRTGAEITLSRPLSDPLTVFSSARFEGVDTNNVATLPGDQFIQQDGDIASVTLGLVQNTRDLDISPSAGYYLRGSVEFGQSDITKVGGIFNDSSLIGSHTFSKYSLDGRYYISLQGKRKKATDLKRVLALRFFYAHIEGTVPFWEQYFIGGADNLRGYQEDRFWGKEAFLGSVELRIPLQKSLTLVTFLDYGDAWGGFPTVNEFTQHGEFEGNLGYGAGVHFQTPLGPLRLDFGFNEDGNVRTHFRVGHSF